MSKEPGFQIYKTKRGYWRWRLWGEGKENIGNCGQNFKTRTRADEEVGKVKNIVLKENGIDWTTTSGSNEMVEPPEFEFDPSQLTTVDSSVLMNSWQNKGFGCCIQAYFVDREYTVPTKSYMDKIIEASTIDKIEYVKEKKDCDDFARMFYAETSFIYNVTAVALIFDFSAGHAYNAFWAYADKKLNLYILEPQTDQIVTLGSEMYKGNEGIAFI